MNTELLNIAKKAVCSIVVGKVISTALKTTVWKVVLVWTGLAVVWKYAKEKYEEYISNKELEEFRKWKKNNR